VEALGQVRGGRRATHPLALRGCGDTARLGTGKLRRGSRLLELALPGRFYNDAFEGSEGCAKQDLTRRLSAADLPVLWHACASRCATSVQLRHAAPAPQVLSGADCASRLAQEAGVRPNLAEDIARQWKRKIGGPGFEPGLRLGNARSGVKDGAPAPGVLANRRPGAPALVQPCDGRITPGPCSPRCLCHSEPPLHPPSEHTRLATPQSSTVRGSWRP
jgi:hypothetical protein